MGLGIKRRLADIIVFIVPGLERAELEVALGYLKIDIPGYRRIDPEVMFKTTKGKILFLAELFLDPGLEDILNFVSARFDPFTKYETSEDEYYEDENENLIMADGGVPGSSSTSDSSGGLVSTLLKFSLFVIPIVVVFLLLSGSGYLTLAGNQAGFQLGFLSAPEIGATVAQAAKTAECLGNAACVRQWQFNNTQRPGSEAVGQEYSLQISEFEVNDGFPLDVANRRAGDRIPADFSVYNPRRGLKGIEARNVAYRIRIFDGTGTLLNLPECQTGWMPLGGEYADNDFGQNGTILPGGFATPLGTHSSLNLENCGLLQPALGIQRRVKLQLAYDYSSQSTLQVQAMSEENMRSLEQRPGFEKSQTADTPVKTYVNVESPITYRRSSDGGAESSVFGVRLGFETGQSGIKYRVNVDDFELYDSGETIDVTTSDAVNSSVISCEDLKLVEGDRYTFSDNMTDYLSSRQSDSWFESDSGPSPARCSMVLENPESISPTGETLTFRVDANYTIMLEEQVDNFEVQNSRCSQFECPMLVPYSHDRSGDDGPLLSQCDTGERVDANNGCGARLGEEWTNVAGDYAINPSVDSEIERGETAYNINNVLDDLPGYVESSFNLEETVVGLEQQIVSKLRNDEAESFAALSVVNEREGGKDIEYEQIDVLLCSSQPEDRFRELWNSNNDGNILYFNPFVKECGANSLADDITNVIVWAYETPEEEYNKVKEQCNSGVIVASRGGLECYELGS